MHGSLQAILRAQAQLERGQVDAAIDTLAQWLGVEPDDADAHALLALCLVRRKRLHAAGLEAGTALALAPDSAFAHVAAAGVAQARGHPKLAESHLHTALELDPEDVGARLQLVDLHLYWGRHDEAERHAKSALALAPELPSACVAAGEVAFARGRHADASTLALEALERDPEHVAALVLQGRCELAAGRTDAAREHAAWALQLAPEDAPALALLCGIKARSSWLLGLWWRFQSFLTSGSGTRMVLILLGAFLVYRATGIVLEDAGRSDLAGPLRNVWLAFCAYTWFAPMLFMRSLRKEIDEVRLRPDF